MADNKLRRRCFYEVPQCVSTAHIKSRMVCRCKIVPHLEDDHVGARRQGFPNTRNEEQCRFTVGVHDKRQVLRHPVYLAQALCRVTSRISSVYRLSIQLFQRRKLDPFVDYELKAASVDWQLRSRVNVAADSDGVGLSRVF